jgi:predicted transcriptional regulator
VNVEVGMAESERRAAGALEAEVMAVLQRAGRPLNATDVQALLASELAYTTVVTILSRMHGKGLLTRAKEGRAFRYAPVSDEPGLVARRMHRTMAAEADREAVLARFVDTLSDQDERLLRDLLDGR